MKPFHRFTLTNLSRAIAVSPAVEQNLQKIFPKQKIEIIANGINTENLTDEESNKSREEFRFLHNIPFDAQVIGTIGELYRTLNDIVTDQLRGAILSGELPPGTTLKLDSATGQNWFDVVSGELGLTLIGDDLPLGWTSEQERQMAPNEPVPVLVPGTRIWLHNLGDSDLILYALRVEAGDE